MPFINEKLQIEEHFYPLSLDYNPIFESLILQNINYTEVIPPGCHANMTRWNIHNESSEMKHFISWILDITQENFINPNVDISSPYRVECLNTWGIIMNEGDYLESHNHIPSRYSFTYYINAPEGSSPLIFPSSGYEVNPEAGKVVIFESRLLHEVLPNHCKNRYSFVGNLIAFTT